ncbi:unnamed protein product [Closterium sp. Naga37s-1]|nr:unnamed protein product [Closterium sp. Naga37s-1]
MFGKEKESTDVASSALKWRVSRFVLPYLPPGYRELPVVPTAGSRMKSSQLVHWIGLLALFTCASTWLLAPTLSWSVSKPPPVPPRLILVTPTYARAFQAAYLTELTHTLRLVPPPHTWIVVESGNKTEETAMLLERTAGYCAAAEAGGLLSSAPLSNTPFHPRPLLQNEDQRWFRGVGQRNLALEYIERENLEGIVYFMDDDNSYALQLFDELRKIQRIGLLPVGFLFGKDSPMRSYVGRPIVRVPVEGDPEARRYIMDMAGFAFSTEALRNGTVQGKKQPIRFRPSKRGFLETDFLEQLVTHEDEFEVLADGCRAVWVWHKHMEDLSWAKYPEDWQPEQSNHRIPTYDWVKNDSSHEARAGLIGGIARVANVTLPPSFEEMKREEAMRAGRVEDGGSGMANGQKVDLRRNGGVASRGDSGGRNKMRGRREDGTKAARSVRDPAVRRIDLLISRSFDSDSVERRWRQTG